MSTDVDQARVTAKIFPHPLNAWYAVAWDHEVTSKGLLARTIAGMPMALYRTADGRPVALADACWHRLAPLSMGKLIGADEVQCPYHGLRYNSAGRCTSMPAQETINPSAMVPSYPVVERYRYLWVWPGDMTLADPDLIPDMHQMDDPGVGRRRPDDRRPVQLPADPRQPDGPHARGVRARLAASARPSSASRSSTPASRTTAASRSTRWMLDVAPPPFWRKNIRDRFPDFEGHVDRWQIIHYYAPSTICIDVGVAKAGTGAPRGRPQPGRQRLRHEHDHPGDRPQLALLLGVHAQLPARQPADHDAAARRRAQGVFAEDEAMLTAQQAAIDANPDHEFYSLNIDAGGMWVRRILDRMLRRRGARGRRSRTGPRPVR